MTGRSRASRHGGALGVLLIILAVAFLFMGPRIAPYVQSAFADLLRWGKPNSAYEGVSRDTLVSRLQVAEEELTRIRYQAYLYELVSKENAELRNVSSVESFSKTVPARVLARPPRTHYDTLILDVGAASGIRENDLVVWNQVLLGTIVSVGPSTATVELLSSPGNVFDAILGTPQAVAVAKGMGGGAFELALPQNITLEVGEVVRAQHSDTLIAGVVVSFEAKPSDATQTVTMRSPVSMQALDYVSVVSGSDL